VNWQHLRAFFWLKWRLMVNQWRRSGVVNVVLMMIVTIAALVTAIPLFVGSLVLAVYLIPKAAPVHLLYMWDGLVCTFLFFWMIGLVTELQRSEPLSLSRFMHLPVSVNGAFLINYVSSLLRLSLIVFGPIMFAFALALMYIKGISQAAVLPLLAAFLVMISALTYQFQGWLAAIMSNPRRRRTVVVAMTMGLILVSQIPNLLNLTVAPWGPRSQGERSRRLMQDMEKLNRAVESREIDVQELGRQQQALMKKHEEARRQVNRDAARTLERMFRIGNAVLPIGWLPLGVTSSAEGRFAPAILGLLGMGLIGTASLWRAYGTTVRLYQGGYAGRKGRKASAIAIEPALPATTRKPSATLLEARLPWLSEPVSAVALGGLRSLVRSPEAKMMLLTPLIMCVVFGSAMFGGRMNVAVSIRPLIGIGAIGVVLLGLVQMMFNQFGFDRDGFRVYVLSAASRRDILLGKNLAFAALGFVAVAVLLVIAQVVLPMRPDHLLAMVPQFVSMNLLFCLVMNLLSILAPTYVAPGSIKASNPKFGAVFLQLAMIMTIVPLTQATTLIPIGAEALLNQLGYAKGAPIFLVLALVQCALVVVIYRWLLSWQAVLFQSREQLILQTVTGR
jgi:ABC-2 type transport system permease protein